MNCLLLANQPTNQTYTRSQLLHTILTGHLHLLVHIRRRREKSERSASQALLQNKYFNNAKKSHAQVVGISRFLTYLVRKPSLVESNFMTCLQYVRISLTAVGWLVSGLRTCAF